MKTKSNNKTGIYLGSLLVCFVMSFAAHAQQAHHEQRGLDQIGRIVQGGHRDRCAACAVDEVREGAVVARGT